MLSFYTTVWSLQASEEMDFSLLGANECPLQELTGKLPRAFPLETGEKPPVVQRRAGLAPNSKAEVSQHLEYQ